MLEPPSEWDRTAQSQRFHLPLRPGDSEQMTHGCRHTQPVICGKNELADVCAFVRPDGICHAPPTSWPKQFAKLLAMQEALQ